MSHISTLILIYFLSSNAFANTSPFGTFVVVKGDVKVQSKGSQKSAKVADKVFQGDVVTTAAGARAKIQMNDRSVVMVSPESKVTIAQHSETSNSKNVELVLSSGKVRSDVKGQNNKYIIKTPTAVAGVRGTDFIVGHDVKTNATEVFTLKGSVEMSALKDGAPAGNPVIINQNQKATVTPGKPVDPPQTVSKEDKQKADSDTKVSDSSGSNGNQDTPPQANNENKDKKDKKNSNSGEGSGNSAGNGPKDPPANKEDKKIRMGDTKDVAPDNFDQVPAPPATGALPPPTTPNKFLPPPIDPRTRDAIRDKTDKTTVIIRPE